MGGPPPPPPTLGVCVVSIASDSKHGCEFLQHVQEDPAHWSIVGIGRWISDAAVAKIQDCGDSHHPHTQATVIGSAGFPELLVYLLGLLRAGYTRFVIVSRLGLFLSDIVGRFLTDAANYAKDPSGWRIYNCAHYNVSMCRSRHELMEQIDCVKAWTAMPWTLKAVSLDITCLYAYHAAMSSPTSAKNWQIIWNFVCRTWPLAVRTQQQRQQQPPAASG